MPESQPGCTLTGRTPGACVRDQQGLSPDDVTAVAAQVREHTDFQAHDLDRKLRPSTPTGGSLCVSLAVRNGWPQKVDLFRARRKRCKFWPQVRRNEYEAAQDNPGRASWEGNRARDVTRRATGNSAKDNGSTHDYALATTSPSTARSPTPGSSGLELQRAIDSDRASKTFERWSVLILTVGVGSRAFWRLTVTVPVVVLVCVVESVTKRGGPRGLSCVRSTYVRGHSCPIGVFENRYRYASMLLGS